MATEKVGSSQVRLRNGAALQYPTDYTQDRSVNNNITSAAQNSGTTSLMHSSTHLRSQLILLRYNISPRLHFTYAAPRRRISRKRA